MKLTVALQMDPIEQIDINTDSTFVLALEAQRRETLIPLALLDQHLV
jgi:hypothetical protein